jgi:hypothetical protein
MFDFGRTFLKLTFKSFLAICFLGNICLQPVVGQNGVSEDDKPVFWTTGSEYGRWSPYANYPHFEFRVACGDETEMKGHPVSSQDWEIRSKYAEPMTLAFRVQFYDDRIGKDDWSAWVQWTIQPGQNAKGWEVNDGHCSIRKPYYTQIKCAAPEKSYETVCLKSRNGRPYPERANAFTGEHDSNYNFNPSRVGGATSSNGVKTGKSFDPFATEPASSRRNCQLSGWGNDAMNSFVKSHSNFNLLTLPGKKLQFSDQTVSYTLDGPRKNNSGVSGDDVDTDIYFRSWTIDMNGTAVEFHEALWINPQTHSMEERQTISGEHQADKPGYVDMVQVACDPLG